MLCWFDLGVCDLWLLWFGLLSFVFPEFAPWGWAWCLIGCLGLGLLRKVGFGLWWVRVGDCGFVFCVFTLLRFCY